MVTVALVVAAVSLGVSLLVALAVIELVADRGSSRAGPADDEIENFELSPSVAEVPASGHGLPAWIDDTVRHVVLVVSPMCAMCAKLAESFAGTVPSAVTVVVVAGAPDRKRDWASGRGLPLDEVVFDDDMSIVNSLGVTSSPTAVGFGRGMPSFSVGLGGRAALDSLLEQMDVIGRDSPTAAMAGSGSGGSGSASRRDGARRPPNRARRHSQ